MADAPSAYKQSKKGPFLDALARIGFIVQAARAVRISRDAVHDWRRNDPTFAAAFLQAKAAYKTFKASGYTRLTANRQPSRTQTEFPSPNNDWPQQQAISGPDGGNSGPCAIAT